VTANNFRGSLSGSSFSNSLLLNGTTSNFNYTGGLLSQTTNSNSYSLTSALSMDNTFTN